jgi:hypothetical protein
MVPHCTAAGGWGGIVVRSSGGLQKWSCWAALVTLHLSQQCAPIAAFLPHPVWQGEANCHAGGGGIGLSTGVPGRLSAGGGVQGEAEPVGVTVPPIGAEAAAVSAAGECWAAALWLAAASALMARCSHSGP